MTALGRWVLTEFQMQFLLHLYLNLLLQLHGLDFILFAFTECNLDTMSFYITKSSEEQKILYALVTVK